ncbi:MAG: hypothetical protein QXK50_03135 [Ignisphaera sp.]
MSVPEILYSIANELYEVLESLYSRPRKRLNVVIAIVVFILLVSSSLYGDVFSKLVILSISFTVMLLIGRSPRDTVHIYVDLLVFLILIALPAIVVNYILFNDIVAIALSLLHILLNTITISTVSIMLIMAIGIDGVSKTLFKISRFFGYLFTTTFLLLPKVIIHITSLILARTSRTLKLNRLNLLKILVACLGDTVFHGIELSQQMVLAIESRTIVDNIDRGRSATRSRLNVLDYILLILSLSIAIAVYSKWI